MYLRVPAGPSKSTVPTERCPTPLIEVITPVPCSACRTRCPATNAWPPDVAGTAVHGSAHVGEVVLRHPIAGRSPRRLLRSLRAGDHRLRAGHLGEEQARGGDSPRAAVVAHPRAAGTHLLATPREADEDEPPLLLELVGPLETALVGHDAVLERGEVDDRKLQALRGVERHERHAIAGRIPGVGVGDERGHLEEAAERIDVRLPGITTRGPARGDVLVELPRGGEQFLRIGEPVEPLLVLVALLLEHPSIAGAVEHRLDERRHPRVAAGNLAEAGMEAREGGQSTGRPRGEAGQVRRVRGRFEQTEPMFLGPRTEPVERLPAESPRRHVHHPQQRLVVPRVAHEPQPRDEVTDLAAAKELEAAHELVGNAARAQRHLQRSGEGVGAEQDRDIPGPAAARGHGGGDLVGDAVGLLVAGGIEHDPHGRSRRGVGDEPLRLASGVVGDEPVGRAEDVGGGAVVAFQLHHRGGRVVALELEDVADARAPPAIDGLIRVSGHGEMRMVDREPAQDAILHGVGVLVLVDENEAVAGVERGAELGLVDEEAGHVHEQVVEVDGVGSQECLLVGGPHATGHLVDGTAPARLEGVGREQVVLGPADHARHPVDRRAGQGHAALLRGPLQQRPRVVRVEDGVVARESDEPRVPAQQPGGEAVEGAHLDRLRTGQGRHAAAHLVGRLVGEGEGDDLLRTNARGDQVGDAVRDDAGLAAARPCQHEQRPLDVRGSLSLGVVEGVEHRHEGCFRCGCRGLPEPPGFPRRLHGRRPRWAVWTCVDYIRADVPPRRSVRRPASRHNAREGTHATHSIQESRAVQRDGGEARDEHGRDRPLRPHHQLPRGAGDLHGS
jgi:hypothetical protein